MTDRVSKDNIATGMRTGGNLPRRHAVVVSGLLLSVAAMVGLVSYAPTLYRIFCEVTGFGGTTRTVQTRSVAVADRQILVRFDANVAPGLPWTFTPPQPVRVKLGEEAVVSYKGRNVGNAPFLGTATFNVVPFKAGEYFNKIECFCFTEQLLLPGQEQEFTVRFFIDPKLESDTNLRDVTTITLSYTFFNQGRKARDRYMAERNIRHPSGAKAVGRRIGNAVDGDEGRFLEHKN